MNANVGAGLQNCVSGKESKMTKFLQDEVRSGFYIPTAIKQAWAVQLKILSEIDRICSKYNIKYFADWGTFLGAVRHGGFVPWDDDLDICMLREDYESFKRAAKSELPDGYAIHNFETKENHWLFLARVVNTNSICFDKKHLDENYNFPYIATVDIFILDYLYEDEEKERKRCDEVKRIIALADGIIGGSTEMTVAAKLLGELEEKYGLKSGSLKTSQGMTDSAENRRNIGILLYHLAEKQMGRTPKDEAGNIGQIFPWILRGSRGLPKEYYEKAVRLPFEFTTIPVPAYYHKALAGRYGEYMRVRKIWGGHDYPYFEGQRANLQAVADFKLPEFTFNKNMLRENQPPIDKSGSLKTMAIECIAELEKLVCGIESVVAEKFVKGQAFPTQNEVNVLLGKLADCQQLAVDLGTLVEEVKGENRESTRAVVAGLEGFCETVYGLYMHIQGLPATNDEQITGGQQTSELVAGLNAVKETVEKYVINRKEVLFVVAGENRWDGYKSLYDMAAADSSVDVYVLKVPLMQKDVYGNILPGSYDTEDADWKNYALDLHMPDVIFIQDEYDRENPCLTVPEMYYAENLRWYTEKLIFVPPFTVNEFTREDSTDWYNMKHYVTAPGVVRSDVILVQSENMRRNYIERLTEFAGENTRDIWESKIIILEKALGNIERTDSNADRNMATASQYTPKRLLYCIGLNEIFEHRENILEKLQDRLDIMEKNTDKLDTVVCIYPPDKSVWVHAAPDLAEKIFEKVKVADKNGMTAKALDDFDAYYGSPTRYAHYFNVSGKPVMLCDYSV
jgi:phosphorylcholine metabolism protein LicD